MKKACVICLRRKGCLGRSALCDYKCADFVKDQKALDARLKRKEAK